MAIVILNWNGRQYLQQFLPSVLATKYSNFRVVVADNASTDDSIEFLKIYPQVEIIQFEQNLGFAKGYNKALKKISCDYYVLLNSDVEVTKEWLTPMIELLQTKDDFAACQPKILAYNNKNFFEYAGAAGGWLDAYGYPFGRGRIFDVCEEDRGQYDNTSEVFWASGAAFVVKAAVFHKLDGFDQYFFAHQEEIDLCWRMQLAGYKIFCCPESVIYHVGGGTLPRGNTKKTFLNFRNNHIMLAKNLPSNERWWKIPFRMFLDILSASKGLLSGDGGYFMSILKAHCAFVYWLALNNKKSQTGKKKTSSLNGVYKGNVVWQHFIKKKSRFSQIIAPD